MKLKSTLLLITALMLNFGMSFAQESLVAQDNAYKLSELRISAVTSSDERDYGNINTELQASKKSPGLALIYSLLLPGTGHWYLDRMDVGKYFVGVEAASWTGFIALTVQGDNVIDDAKSYSVEHAQVSSPDSRDDDFYANVGNFNSVYDYNNDKLTRGEYNLLYNVQDNFWNWDSGDNRNIFDVQRRDSERIYNNRIIFGSFLIANRVVSAISAYLIAKNMNSKRSYSIVPEVYRNNSNSVNGLGMKFITNF